MKRKYTRLNGYEAAAKIIQLRLDEVEPHRPRCRVNRRLAAYRAGYYEALLSAHCWLVLGEFPNEAANQSLIDDTLNK